MKLGRPLLTTDMSGSLGGMVAAKARGGVLYVRSRVRPSNPRSGFQSNVRLVLSGIAAKWKTLTAPQLAAWSALAGSAQSGIDAFVKVNSQIVLSGNDRVDTPPASITLEAEPLTDIAIDVSDGAVKYNALTFGDDIYCNVYLSTNRQTFSRGAQQFAFRYLGTVHQSDTGAQTINFAGTWADAIPVAGTIMYAKFVQFDVNGKVALEQIKRVTVQA